MTRVGVGQRIDAMRDSGMLGQLVRFGIAGVISSIIYTAVYLPLATWTLPRADAWMAVPPAFVVAVTAGFFLHSTWSFRGHGERQSGARQPMKFVVVQSSGMLLNALYAWVLSDLMHQPAWVPLIPAVLVTPFVTFGINRKWVFA